MSDSEEASVRKDSYDTERMERERMQDVLTQ